MSRRRTLTDLADLVARLGGEPTGSYEDALVALEGAVAALSARAEASEASFARLAFALDALGEGVLVVDAAGSVEVRNAAAAPFHEARHAEALAEDAVEGLLGAARRGEAGEREVELFGPPRRLLHLSARPLVTDGRIVGAVAVVDDVTEARHVEHVRRDFVANVSHELKTPIGALALLAETMAAGGDAAEMRTLAERLLRETDRLSRMVDDLLDLGAVEGQEAPRFEPVAVGELVDEVIEEVRAGASAAGVPLDVSPRLPAGDVVCDRRQVRTALVNLLDNAVKYSDAGRAVELSVHTEDGDRVAFVIRDHGIGIPARDLERIFERFYRVDRARSRQTGGTGLGLSIVRHVALSHGGEVRVESVEGEGSTFTLVIGPGEVG